jgi:anti-sigma B factor antagonist
VLFDIQVHERDGWVVLAPIGEVDLASAPRLRQAALAAAPVGPLQLIIDLGGVDFLDSMGIGVLVALHKRAVAGGGAVRLTRPAPHVRRLLELVGLTRVLPVLDTVDDAVSSR